MELAAYRRLAGLMVVVSTAALAACGDARVKELSKGIARDSVLTILGDGSPVVQGDSLPHVYDVAKYLVNGQSYEVFYYTKTEEKAGADSVPPNRLTPIVLQNDAVSGWGWEHWDSVAKTINLPVPPRK